MLIPFLCTFLLCLTTGHAYDCVNALVDFDNCSTAAANDSERTVVTLIEKYKSQIEQCFVTNGCDIPLPSMQVSVNISAIKPPMNTNMSQYITCVASAEKRHQEWVIGCVNQNKDCARLPPPRTQSRDFGKRHYLDPREIGAVIKTACNKTTANNTGTGTIIGQCIYKIFNDHVNDSQAAYDQPCSTRKVCEKVRNNCSDMISASNQVATACYRNWTVLAWSNMVNATDGLQECIGIDLFNRNGTIRSSAPSNQTAVTNGTALISQLKNTSTAVSNVIGVLASSDLTSNQTGGNLNITLNVPSAIPANMSVAVPTLANTTINLPNGTAGANGSVAMGTIPAVTDIASKVAALSATNLNGTANVSLGNMTTLTATAQMTNQTIGNALNVTLNVPSIANMSVAVPNLSNTTLISLSNGTAGTINASVAMGSIPSNLTNITSKVAALSATNLTGTASVSLGNMTATATMTNQTIGNVLNGTNLTNLAPNVSLGLNTPALNLVNQTLNGISSGANASAASVLNSIPGLNTTNGTMAIVAPISVSAANMSLATNASISIKVKRQAQNATVVTKLRLWAERPMDACGVKYFYNEYLRL